MFRYRIIYIYMSLCGIVARDYNLGHSGSNPHCAMEDYWIDLGPVIQINLHHRVAVKVKWRREYVSHVGSPLGRKEDEANKI